MSLKERLKLKKLKKRVAAQGVGTQGAIGQGMGSQGAGGFKTELEDEKSFDHLSKIKEELGEFLYDNMNTTGMLEKYSESERNARLKELLERQIDREYANVFISKPEREMLILELINDNKFFGPLTQLFDDNEVSAIYVNGAHNVYVERDSRMFKTAVKFKDIKHLLSTIEKIFANSGKQIQSDSTSASIKLADGTTVSATFPPLSEKIYLVIKKFNRVFCSADALIETKFLTDEISTFLNYAVKQNINIVITGANASGKSTLLCALTHALSDQDRVVLVRNSNEVDFSHEHLLKIKAGDTSVNEAMMLSPNRIIFPDIDPNALYTLLNTKNQGINGVITTYTTVFPEQILAQMKNNISRENQFIPEKTADKMTAASLDLVLHVSKIADGKLKLVSILKPLLSDNGLTLQNIIEYKEAPDSEGTMHSRYYSTGVYPDFMNINNIEESGLNIRFFDTEYEHDDLSDNIEIEDEGIIVHEKSPIAETFKKPRKLSIKSRIKKITE